MLPGLDLDNVPSQTNQEDSPYTHSNSIDKNNTIPTIPEIDIEENVHETQPLHSAEPSAEQKESIREIQKLRNFTRARSKSKCLIGMDYKNHTEQEMIHLTPNKGRARINPRTTEIRYVLDQYKQHKPYIELHHPFDFSRACWEFVYNYFWIFAFPLLLYREGCAGFRARAMLTVFAFLGFIPWAVCNVAFWLSHKQTKHCFLFPFFVMNLLQTATILVLAIKYGYFPTKTFAEYNDADHKITWDYINSLHMIQGWMVQHPLAIARELYYTEQRLGIDTSALRLTFRDTKAFDLQKGQHCSCSRYWTTLDWLVPYVVLNVDSATSLTKPKMFKLYLVLFVLLILYTTIARILPWSISEVSMEDCDVYCWTIIGSLPLCLGWRVFTAWSWCMCMSHDFTRRWNRMKLCTHLLDAKRETFQGTAMRRSYKAQLFGSVSKVGRKTLKSLDLQTIDMYSSESLYSWSQFRNILFDTGKMFHEREEAYNGLFILCTLFLLFFFLYCLTVDWIVIVWEDLIITVVVCTFILVPSMWVLSCGNSLNYQTTKQQKILSERAVEMLHYQYMAEDKNLSFWVIEMVKAREMCDAVIDVLNLHEYDVRFLGIKVDNSVFQLVGSVIGIMGYLIGWIVYQNMIKGE